MLNARGPDLRSLSRGDFRASSFGKLRTTLSHVEGSLGPQALQDSSISSLSTNVARRRQRSVCFSSARVPDLVRL